MNMRDASGVGGRFEACTPFYCGGVTGSVTVFIGPPVAPDLDGRPRPQTPS